MEFSINDGRIREYDVNVKIEHKIYSQIYDILLALKDEDYLCLERYKANYDLDNICRIFWNNKDKDIID